MKPSMGKIVIYNHPEHPDWPQELEKKKSPAIISYVLYDEGGQVILWVFATTGFFNRISKQGDGPGQWNFIKEEEE